MITPTTGGDPYTTPELGRSALIVIDTQVNFCDGGASPIPGTTDPLDPATLLAGHPQQLAEREWAPVETTMAQRLAGRWLSGRGR